MDISMFLLAAAAANMSENEPAIATVAITGITIVFAVLVLLYVIISLEGVLFKSIDAKKSAKAAEAKKPAAPAPQVKTAAPAPAPVVEKGIPGEVVAAIAAAIAAMEGGSKYVIRSLSRAKKGRSSWSSAGVSSNTEPF